MSEKCANIFCLKNSLEDCKKFMKELEGLPTRDMQKEFLALRGTMTDEPPVSARALSVIAPFLKMFNNTKMIMVKTDKAILLTSEFWVWGEAYVKAIEISKKLLINCFTIDYKEYGVFVLHLIENGNIISKHAFGNELDQYGFEKSSINFEAFSSATGNDSSELESAFTENDKAKIIDNLTSLVGIECTMAFDDLQDLLATKAPQKSNKKCELYVIE